MQLLIAVLILLSLQLAATTAPATTATSQEPSSSTVLYDDDDDESMAPIEEIDWQLMNVAIGAGYWMEDGNPAAGYVAWNCQALCNSHRQFMQCCNAMMGRNQSEYWAIHNLCTNNGHYSQPVPCGITEDKFIGFKTI